MSLFEPALNSTKFPTLGKEIKVGMHEKIVVLRKGGMKNYKISTLPFKYTRSSNWERGKGARVKTRLGFLGDKRDFFAFMYRKIAKYGEM